MADGVGWIAIRTTSDVCIEKVIEITPYLGEIMQDEGVWRRMCVPSILQS